MAKRPKRSHRCKNAPHIWQVDQRQAGVEAIGRYCKAAGLGEGPQLLLGLYVDRDMPKSGRRKGVAFPPVRWLMERLPTKRSDTVRAWKKKLLEAGVIADLYRKGQDSGTAAVGIRYQVLLGAPVEDLLVEGIEMPAWVRDDWRPTPTQRGRVAGHSVASPPPADRGGVPTPSDRGGGGDGQVGWGPPTLTEGGMEDPRLNLPKMESTDQTFLTDTRDGLALPARPHDRLVDGVLAGDRWDEAALRIWLDGGPANDAADHRAVPAGAIELLLPPEKIGLPWTGPAGATCRELKCLLSDAGKLRRFWLAAIYAEVQHHLKSRHGGPDHLVPREYVELAERTSARLDRERACRGGWLTWLQRLADRHGLDLLGPDFEGRIDHDGMVQQVAVRWRGAAPITDDAFDDYCAAVRAFYEAAIAAALLNEEHSHHQHWPARPMDPVEWRAELERLAEAEFDLRIVDAVYECSLANLPNGSGGRVLVGPSAMDDDFGAFTYDELVDVFYDQAAKAGLVDSMEPRSRVPLAVDG